MNPDNNQEPNSQTNDSEPKEVSKEVSFDDKQQEKVNQLVSQAKAKEKDKSDQIVKELQGKVNSIPDLIKSAIAKHDAEANMTDKEKADAETADLKKKLEELQAENQHRNLINSATKIAESMKLPLSFAELFVGSTDDETKQNLESVKTEFDNAVQESVENRLKGKSTPQTATGNATVTLDKDLKDMSLEELTKVYMENPDLIKKDYLNK